MLTVLHQEVTKQPQQMKWLPMQVPLLRQKMRHGLHVTFYFSLYDKLKKKLTMFFRPMPYEVVLTLYQIKLKFGNFDF